MVQRRSATGIVALLCVAGVAWAGVSVIGDRAYDGMPAVSVGTIPARTWRTYGYTLHPAPPWRIPSVSLERAQYIALHLPIYYFHEKPQIRDIELVLLEERGAPGARYLEWFVDISPACPFHPLSGGGIPGPNFTPPPPPSPVPGCPGAFTSMPTHVFVEINAISGVAGEYLGG